MNSFPASLFASAIAVALLAGSALSKNITGDCNEDGRVSINELLLGVNIALGRAATTTCEAFDSSGDGAVRVDELVEGVHAALMSGSVSSPTAKPLPTATATAGGSLCDATVVGPVLPIHMEGHTEGTSQLGGAQCGWGGGNEAPERVFAFTAPATGRYQFAAAGRDFTALLYVRAHDCHGRSLACSDGQDQLQPQSVSEIALVAGEAVAVIVDGIGTGAGDFAMDLDLLRPDLVLDRVDGPPSATRGETIDLTATVKNIGGAEARRLDVHVFFMGQRIYSNVCRATPLTKGDSTACPIRLQVPRDAGVDAHLLVSVDPVDERRVDNNMAEFPIKVGPILTFVESRPISITIADASTLTSADGRYRYTADRCQNTIAVSRADTDPSEPVAVYVDGVGGVEGLEFVKALALSPDGQNLYAAGAYEDAIAVFGRDPETGSLTYLEAKRDGIDGVEGLDFVTALTLSPDGTLLFAAGGNDDALAVFRRDARTGTLSFAEQHRDGVAGVDGLDFPAALQMSEDGSALVVVGEDDDAEAVFRINR